MACGVKFDGDVAEFYLFAIGDDLRSAGEIVAVAQPHHVEGFLRRQPPALARPGMVGMGVGDHGALDRPYRIDMEAPGFAAQPGGNGHKDVLRTHLGYIIRYETHSSLAVHLPLKPAIGSDDARAPIPVLRRSGCRPPVRFCARSAAEGRSRRRRRSALTGHGACARLCLGLVYARTDSRTVRRTRCGDSGISKSAKTRS